MSDTDSQPQLPADTPPPPDYAPDVHTRTRVLRRDWWRTPSDPPEHGRGRPEPSPAPEPYQADQDAAPEDEEDSPQEEAEQPSRLGRLRRALGKGDAEEAADNEDAQEDGEPDAEEGERPAAPRTSPARSVPRPRQQPSREALFDWWARRDARQRFVLTNGAAAACGAYGPGLLSYRWDLGLPQLVLSWMRDAAASSTSSSTPLVLGGLAVVGAAVGGGMAAGIVLRFVQAVPTLCRITHWCLVRVPVASAVLAVCLYTS
ncbi:hypothetical protein ACPYPG_07020 [Streptomyces sp. FR-108]|uniref:hypothetical protein n=1 Tax=Streptomyces sp. FR-108 TaxID=3416665 RepID=UPI003CEB105F